MHGMSRLRPLGAAAMVAGSAVLLPIGAPAEAAPATCHGVRATKVGTPKANLLGTRGRDVIVSNGARQVRTNGGDDLVCITGGAEEVEVQGDDGDEKVYVETRRSSVSYDGELGSDTFVGSGNGDWVYLRLDGDDRVSTGGGDDDVELRQAANRGKVRVTLGSGDDAFHVSAARMRGVVDGGTGSDTLSLVHDSKHGWVFDNREGRATSQGKTRFRWKQMDYFPLELFDAPSLAFVGGDGPETVVHQDSADETPTFMFAMGGGDDLIEVSSHGHGSMDGGPGVDRVVFGVNDSQGLLSLVADLAAHTAFVDYETGRDYSWMISGLEQVHAYAFPTVTLRGDDSDNLLIGGGGNDTLVGNGGTDTADGSSGSDSCDAEVETACELP